MDSMMGGVMGLAWLPKLLALTPIIAASSSSYGCLPTLEQRQGVGKIAPVAVLAMGTMHFGMRCC